MRITLAARIYAVSLVAVALCAAALSAAAWATIGPPPAPPWRRGPPPSEWRPPPPEWRPPPPNLRPAPPELRLPDDRGPPPVFRPPPELPPLPAPGLPGPIWWLFVATVVIGLFATALLVARSLARPLARLGEAARALGAGDLEARTGIAREDELGDLARAFDEMAARVAALVRGQRELLANVSHELRTPLSRIRVGLDLVREGASDAKLLDDLERDLLEVDGLVDDVLTAARLDPAHLGPSARAGGLPVGAREPVVLDVLVDEAARRFARSWPSHALTVAGQRHVVVRGDARLLQRVLDNLLDNAGKYSPPGPVSVRVVAGPAQAHIDVEDHGIGIAPDDVPHLGTPFFRAERSRARSVGGRAAGGMGLGLTLARRIVEAHGGRLQVSSTLGRGTVVRVTLPALPDTIGDASGTAAQHDGP